MRCARIWSWLAAIRTCEVTAPFFCDMPVMSSTEMPLPSRWAAIPISAPMVITPVPPMPLIRMLNGTLQSGDSGDGSGPKPSSCDLPALGFLSLPPSTVTKLGQKPLTQE